MLLPRGAAKVVAVDVGRGQLDPRLAAEKRVRFLEGLDARELDAERLGEPPAAIVIDVSFISQRLVLPHCAQARGRRPAWLVSLVKPQFEVGRADIVKGRVRSEAALERACAGVRACIEAQGWRVSASSPRRSSAATARANS